MLPAAHERGLVDAVAAYCEPIAFSADQVARVFAEATSLGLPVKLHADQLSDSGGAALAARFNAISADHLEYTNVAGIESMAESGTVAVMLPGAFLTLGETQLPPVEAFRANGVPIAVATDCNPGTSPVCSIRTAMTLASRLFRLTPRRVSRRYNHPCRKGARPRRSRHDRSRKTRRSRGLGHRASTGTLLLDRTERTASALRRGSAPVERLNSSLGDAKCSTGSRKNTSSRNRSLTTGVCRLKPVDSKHHMTS